MEITARLTGDAQVRKVNGKEVVAFTIVINESYKTKDGGRKEFATFINCSYWRNSKIAKFLTKSTVVTVTGRIDINAYKTNDGEFHAKLVFHTNNIKILAGGKSAGKATAQEENNKGGLPETKDDLPF
jgi:single-strand DNA-binding protein